MEHFIKEFEKYLNHYQPIEEYDLQTVIYEIFDVKNYDEVINNYTYEITQDKERLIKINGNCKEEVKSIQELSKSIYELFDFILYADFRIVKRNITPKEMIYNFFSASDFIVAFFSGEIIIKGDHYENLFKIYKRDFLDEFNRNK